MRAFAPQPVHLNVQKVVPECAQMPDWHFAGDFLDMPTEADAEPGGSELVLPMPALEEELPSPLSPVMVPIYGPASPSKGDWTLVELKVISVTDLDPLHLLAAAPVALPVFEVKGMVSPKKIVKDQPAQAGILVSDTTKKRRRSLSVSFDLDKNETREIPKRVKKTKKQKPKRRFLFRTGICKGNGRELCAVCHRKGFFTLKWMWPPEGAPHPHEFRVGKSVPFVLAQEKDPDTGLQQVSVAGLGWGEGTEDRCWMQFLQGLLEWNIEGEIVIGKCDEYECTL